MRTCRSCFALFSLAGLLAAAPPLCCLSWFSRGNVVIPFKTVRGLIVSPMSINGKSGRNFVFDTGASATAIDAAAAKAEGIKIASATGEIHTFAANARLATVIPHIAIFGYGLKINATAAVLDLDPLRRWLGIPLTGIIGSDTITSLPVLIDYRAQKITMFLGKNMPDIDKSAAIPLQSLPSAAEESGSPVIAAKLQLPDGRLVSLRLEIDTGNINGLMLHEPFAKKYGLIAAGQPTATSNSLGGKYVVVPAHPAALLLGTQRIVDPDTLCDEKAVSTAASTDVDGEIGYKILSRFRIFIDAPQRFVVFQPFNAPVPNNAKSALPNR
jgi:hypothetical protein